MARTSYRVVVLDWYDGSYVTTYDSVEELAADYELTPRAVYGAFNGCLFAKIPSRELLIAKELIYKGMLINSKA